MLNRLITDTLTSGNLVWDCKISFDIQCHIIYPKLFSNKLLSGELKLFHFDGIIFLPKASLSFSFFLLYKLGIKCHYHGELSHKA